MDGDAVVPIPFVRDMPLAIGGAYEGAEAFDRTLLSWQPPTRSADGDILRSKGLADARALDAARNDAYVRSGHQLHRDLIVGARYALNAKPRIRVLGLDEEWAQEFSEEVEAKFENWAESRENWPDAARRVTLTGLARLAVGVYLYSGEVLATAEWKREREYTYRTAVQMVEPARLANPQDRPMDYDKVRGGVRMNSYGAPLGYYIRRALPGAIFNATKAHQWSYIRARTPVGRPQVLHLLDQERPGQTRGISQLVTALKEMRMLKHFRDVTLQSAVVQASYAATIESELPKTQVFEELGAGSNPASAVVDYAQQFLGAVSAYVDNAKNVHVNGAKIPHLMPGTSLNVNPLGQPGGRGPEFEAAMIRYIASALDVSAEEMSQNFADINYSGARAAMLNTGKHMRSRKRVAADGLANWVFRLWFEEAVNAGHIETMNAQSVPNMYDGLNMDAFTEAKWIGAGFGQIDEYKETQAAALRIMAGLSTYEVEAGRLGMDWRDLMRQTAREQAMMEELDLEFSFPGQTPEPEPTDAGGEHPGSQERNKGSD